MTDWGTVEMEAFWTEMHARNDGPALSGSSLASMHKTLGLSPDRIKPGTRVLEIGVGLGIATKEMVNSGAIVYAMDITSRALARVLPFVKGTFLHRSASDLPIDWFDIATSLLVTQHMSDTDILWQFPHVFRALKPSGRFVIQWAGSDVPGENDNAETILGEYGPTDQPNSVGMISGRMVRSETYATALIERCGGTVLEIRGRQKFPQFKSSWFITECERIRG